MESSVVTVYRALVVLFVLCEIVAMSESDRYIEQRSQLLAQERLNFTGGDAILTQKEALVNRILLQLKKEELDDGYKNSSNFLASQNFLLSRSKIEQSKVFNFIKRIPKGCSLHSHLLASASVNFVIEDITYEDNVYGCYIDEIFKLKFLRDAKQDPTNPWKSLKTYRNENRFFDDFLKEQLTLTPLSINRSKEKVWSLFKNTFSTLFDLISYRPMFKRYVYRVLEELYADNVMYTEIRSAFMNLYDLNGTVYDANVFIDTFIEVVEEFKASHQGFLGAKYILNLYRGVDNDTLNAALEKLNFYKKLYPNFIAGFDFVGNEDDGKNLVDFREQLTKVPSDVKFFFHAGETNWFGRTDLNLADAILLNTSRIGHGHALAKHPVLLELARRRDIPIELCPISNQVLKLHDDPRNHPATVLLSTGFPVVIGNDDPSVWESTGLSYDWYVVFMAMTWEDQGLEVLKKFARDSIQYSAMSASDKTAALDQWEIMWMDFLDEILSTRLSQDRKVYVV